MNLNDVRNGRRLTLIELVRAARQIDEATIAQEVAIETEILLTERPELVALYTVDRAEFRRLVLGPAFADGA